MPSILIPSWTKLLLGVVLGSTGVLLAPADPQGGRGPGPRPEPPKTGTGAKAAEPLYYGSESGQAASAGGIVAVTGSYGVGTSVLYVIDTNSRQLAVYEARGGSENSRRLTLVGARKIDLDLMLEGYNDDSEWSYAKLRERFLKAGHAVPTGSGVTKDSSPARASDQLPDRNR
jgi:hypothetical protein